MTSSHPSSHTIELIDAKIRDHTENAEKHERSAKSYDKLGANERRAEQLYRDLIAELEADKATLQASHYGDEDPMRRPPTECATCDGGGCGDCA